MADVCDNGNETCDFSDGRGSTAFLWRDAKRVRLIQCVSRSNQMRFNSSLMVIFSLTCR